MVKWRMETNPVRRAGKETPMRSGPFERPRTHMGRVNGRAFKSRKPDSEVPEKDTKKSLVVVPEPVGFEPALGGMLPPEPGLLEEKEPRTGLRETCEKKERNTRSRKTPRERGVDLEKAGLTFWAHPEEFRERVEMGDLTGERMKL
ncbi:MAG: hypothetical protein ACLFUZ_00935 [Candidatus Micrarchaeia archaeon]